MPGPSLNLPSALDRFDEIRKTLSDRRPMIFLDYDGTLTPIVDRPEDAVLSEGMRQSLSRLAGRCRIALISGRERREVERLVGIEKIVYAGSHGFDIRGPGNLIMEHEGGRQALPDLDGAQKTLEDRAAGLAGVQVERKRYAVAVHYRRAGERAREALFPIIDQILARHSSLKKTPGKMVVELRPDIDWDKGRALLWLLDHLEADNPNVLPTYIGDDLTDEDALRVMEKRGIGILVGHHGHPTHAAYFLPDVEGVKRFLDRLTQVL